MSKVSQAVIVFFLSLLFGIHQQPVCNSVEGTSPSIDLSELDCYHFGRSPLNHIELHHLTSSRRHALMFHHPNGACYILDCVSAHGTYVNGNRLPPAYPVRVRRGSLIRFGGPGAPCFILKCFSTDLHKLVRDLGSVADAFSSRASHESLLLQQQTQKTGVACIRGGEGGMACVVDEKDVATAALVLLNTRLNAYSGGISSLSQIERPHVLNAKMRFYDKIRKVADLKRNRSVAGFSADSGYSSATKKIGVSMPPRSVPSVEEASVLPKEPLRNRVLFSDECQPSYFFPAAVTPDASSSESEGED